MYECRWSQCKQRFDTEQLRDDHELAARHWDDVEEGDENESPSL